MARKFDFASPGIQINEIDRSQVPAQTTEDGILLIGRSLKGPAMKPVIVKDLDSFIEIFGLPQSGKAASNTDVWRDGNRYGPTYAAYAAQAHLASETSPVTFVRLLGEDSVNAAAGATKAGWNLGGGTESTDGNIGNTLAYGLFIMPSASATGQATGSLAAVIYTTGSSAALRGTAAGGGTEVSAVAQLIESQNSGVGGTFKLDIYSSATAYETYTFHLRSDEKSGFIRNVLNTNPQKINSDSFSSTESYFLGETYEEEVRRILANANSSSAGQQYGILLPLVSGSSHWVDHIKQATAPQTGWIIGREPNPKSAPSDWSSSDMKKLFRVVALHEGEWVQENYAIKIHDLKLGTVTNPNSTFALSVVNKVGESIENFYNLNLNEASDDFILKKIGDENRVWDTTNKVFNVTGEYPNNSNYIRIVMGEDWKSGLSDSYALPFGFYGPTKIKPFTLVHGSQGAQVFGDAVNNGALATMKFTATSATPGVTDGLQITIVDVFGNSVLFTFDSSTNFNSPAKVTANSYTAGCQSATSTEKTRNGLKAAIQLAVTNGDLSVSLANDGTNALDVTQTEFGPFGNTAVTLVGSGITKSGDFAGGEDTDDNPHAWVKGNAFTFKSAGTANLFASLPTDMACSFTFPSLRTTTENTKMGSSYEKTDVMGVRHVYGNTATSNKVVYQSGDYSDLLDAGSAGGNNNFTAGDSTEISFIFTLDEVKQDSSTKLWYWKSGSMADGSSYSQQKGTAQYLKDAPKQFNVPLFGGCDGLDITLVDPFSSERVLSGKDVTTHYAFNSLDKAIDIAADPESVRYDVVSIPGMTNTSLQNKLIRKVEERGDALVIIDIDDDYLESHENSGTRTGGDVATAIQNFQSREMNTSYAATYFPRIKLRDTTSGNNEIVIAPASIAGIGAIAFSEANSEGPWFAPAGFNRGGIGTLGGSSGPRTVGTWKTLSKQNRDELYQENINPIARFPAVGEIVIFGQKTLQQIPSALDRINVRRLMIFLKKKIGAIADTILFDQNVQSTWNRFLSQADPLLASVKTRFGISDYKLVLDSSTTTDDLIDRNILYAKVFVKPAKAIEYIVIDFIVTRSGVEF